MSRGIIGGISSASYFCQGNTYQNEGDSWRGDFYAATNSFPSQTSTCSYGINLSNNPPSYNSSSNNFGAGGYTEYKQTLGLQSGISSIGDSQPYQSDSSRISNIRQDFSLGKPWEKSTLHTPYSPPTGPSAFVGSKFLSTPGKLPGLDDLNQQQESHTSRMSKILGWNSMSSQPSKPKIYTDFEAPKSFTKASTTFSSLHPKHDLHMPPPPSMRDRESSFTNLAPHVCQQAYENVETNTSGVVMPEFLNYWSDSWDKEDGYIFRIFVCDNISGLCFQVFAMSKGKFDSVEDTDVMRRALKEWRDVERQKEKERERMMERARERERQAQEKLERDREEKEIDDTWTTTSRA